MVLVDSDLVIWFLRGKTEIISWMEKIAETEKLAVSAVTVAEVFSNAFPNEITEIKDFFSRHETVFVNYDIAETAGLYFRDWRKRVLKLSLGDCLIAATAKLNNAKLATLNTKHFPMKDIIVLKPD